jgi:hypothetical protein
MEVICVDLDATRLGDSHQEDDTLLGVTWRDLARLGVFGSLVFPNPFAKSTNLRANSLRPPVLLLHSICSHCTYTYVSFEILPFNHVPYYTHVVLREQCDEQQRGRHPGRHVHHLVSSSTIMYHWPSAIEYTQKSSRLRSPSHPP